MVRPLPYLPETASQTAGPYVHIGLAPQAAGFDILPDLGAEIAGPGSAGERIAVEGVVFDGDGAPVRDALIETWQCDGEGRFPAPGGAFRGWGRIAPDLDTGEFRFETVRPGPVAGHAPHITFWLVARGVNVGLHTRMYFPEDDHADDPLLSRIEAPARRATLVAQAAGPSRYRFEIRLQGAGETVFLDI
ncbi:MAG: protocatechuate 3,4-dioxygenase subunit alpha [Rubrimonas sp.]